MIAATCFKRQQQMNTNPLTAGKLSPRIYMLALSLIFATGSLTGSSLPTLRARTAAAAAAAGV